MPSYKTHLAVGTIVFLALLQVTKQLIPNISLNQTVLFASASFFGSLFPDIDIQTSKIQYYFYLASALILFATIITKSWNIFFIVAGICIIVPLIKHRTLTHHIWFIIAIPGLIALFLTFNYKSDFYVTIATYLFFSCSAISHIFLDSIISILTKPFSGNK